MDGCDVSSFRVTELIPVDAAITERRKFLETSIYIYISDIFFNPIISASILTTAVTLKMEAVCSFVHFFVHSFKMSEHLVTIQPSFIHI